MQYKGGINGGRADIMAEGLMNRADITPTKILVTSTDTVQSISWVGTYNDELEIRKITKFNSDQLFFTTAVTIKNTGDSELTDIYCKLLLLLLLINRCFSFHN